MAAADPVELLEQATSTFADRLASVRTEQWDQHSNCDGWTVRDLVGHVLAGNAMSVALLDGASADDALEFIAGLPVDHDASAQFAANAAAQLDAFRAEGAAERICHHPMGDMPGAQVVGFRIGDLTLHAWDLARSTGGDERLPDVLVEQVWADLEPMASMISAIGLFGDGPSGTVPDDASLQTRLLDLAGRRQ
jgi:uncharacterized protein (TIGR03086 family)